MINGIDELDKILNDRKINVNVPLTPRERRYKDKYGMAALKRIKQIGARII